MIPFVAKTSGTWMVALPIVTLPEAEDPVGTVRLLASFIEPRAIRDDD